jgi:hypothetical protein
MYDRETDILQVVQGGATVVTGEDKHALGASDVLVIPGGRCPTSSWTSPARSATS